MMGGIRRMIHMKTAKSSLSVSSISNSYQEIFDSEAFRGERIHWKLNWVFYSILLFFCLIVYFLQHNEAGKVGLYLAVINLAYNTFLTYYIIKNKSVRWVGYVTMMLNVISLTVYTYVDAINNSPLIPATSAALLLYPIIIFLASLRMDKNLVIYTTVICIISMDALYLYFHGSAQLPISDASISADIMSQGYRTVYLIIIGYLIYCVPRSMRRILEKQETLARESTYHRNNAEHDPLTGLYNRLYFEQNLTYYEQMSKSFGYSYALLFIDLNDFKQINDTYGHDIGDFILKDISGDLSKVVRDHDLVARIGGDEFVVMLNQISSHSEIKSLVNRVAQAIARPRTDQGVTLTAHASIGVAVYPEDADSMEKLLKLADKAMYNAKQDQYDNVSYVNIKSAD